MGLFRKTPKPKPSVVTSIGTFRFSRGYWVATCESNAGPIEVVSGPELELQRLPEIEALLKDTVAVVQRAFAFAALQAPWLSGHGAPELEQAVLSPPASKSDSDSGTLGSVRLDIAMEIGNVAVMVWLQDGVPVEAESEHV